MMAIYHFSVKTFSRSKGQSAVAAAAYRSCSAILEAGTGKIHDFTKKRGLDHAEIFLPDAAPTWTRDRQQLWNAVEKAETRKNSTFAREFEIALPGELDAEQRKALARTIASAIVERHGCAVDLCIHRPDDGKNHHAHILLSTRRIGAAGFADKTRELDEKTSGEIAWWRAGIAGFINQALAAAGCNERVDHRAFADRENPPDRLPGVHLGPARSGQRRRGEVKISPDWPTYIAERTAHRQQAAAEKARLDTLIAAEKSRLAGQQRAERVGITPLQHKPRTRTERSALAKTHRQERQQLQQRHSTMRAAYREGKGRRFPYFWQWLGMQGKEIGEISGRKIHTPSPLTIPLKGTPQAGSSGFSTHTTSVGVEYKRTPVDGQSRTALIDQGQKILIFDHDDAALLAALIVARRKWGEAITITGSDVFLARCTRLLALLPTNGIRKSKGKQVKEFANDEQNRDTNGLGAEGLTPAATEIAAGRSRADQRDLRPANRVLTTNAGGTACHDFQRDDGCHPGRHEAVSGFTGSPENGGRSGDIKGMRRGDAKHQTGECAEQIPHRRFDPYSGISEGVRRCGEHGSAQSVSAQPAQNVVSADAGSSNYGGNAGIDRTLRCEQDPAERRAARTGDAPGVVAKGHTSGNRVDEKDIAATKMIKPGRHLESVPEKRQGRPRTKASSPTPF